jgi:hypothetical protein
VIEAAFQRIHAAFGRTTALRANRRFDSENSDMCAVFGEPAESGFHQLELPLQLVI